MTTGLDGRTDAAFAPVPGRGTGRAPGPADDDGADPASDGGSGTPGVRGWWQRNQILVVVAAVLLLGIVLSVATSRSGPGEPLAPDNAAPDGGRALAQVLGRQGVEVREEQALAEVLDQAGPGVTLLVLDSVVLTPELLLEVRDTGATLVLVEPSLPVLQVLAPELALGGVAGTTTTAPGCDDPDAVAAGPARAGSTRYAVGDGTRVPGVTAEPPSPTAEVTVCYPGDGEAGSYAVVVDETEDRRVIVHGQPELLTNEWLAQEGNAALALRSLGREETLLWYRVDPLDVAFGTTETGQSAVDLLPAWVRWAALQLLVVAVVAMVWRFRRLGRLVPERLPAVVRSVETTEGRARLYRAAGARATSAAVLRRAATGRLSSRLSTGRDTDPRTVARLAAAAAGRDPVDVAHVLHGPDPTDDAGLVRLADDLDRLEREVAHR